MRGEDDYAELERTYKITQKLHVDEFNEPILSFEAEDVEVGVSYI